ncbi:MAG: hypothetical protein ACI97P_002205, partial [Arcticibacterium sp.]
GIIKAIDSKDNLEFCELNVSKEKGCGKALKIVIMFFL